MDPADLLTALADHEYAGIITYKRDGRGVATPVWFVVVRGCLHFRTPANTGKVKRLRANPEVGFFACDRTGRRTGPTYRGSAIVHGPQAPDGIVARLNEKYGMTSRMYALTLRLPGRRALFVEITPHRP